MAKVKERLFWGLSIFFVVCVIVTLIVYFAVYNSFVKNNKVLSPTTCTVSNLFFVPTTCSRSCNCHSTCNSKGSCHQTCSTCYYSCYDHYATLDFNGESRVVQNTNNQSHNVFLYNDESVVTSTYIGTIGSKRPCYYNVCPLRPYDDDLVEVCKEVTIGPCFLNKFDETAALVGSVISLIITCLVFVACIVFLVLVFGHLILGVLHGMCDMSSFGYQPRRKSTLNPMYQPNPEIYGQPGVNPTPLGPPYPEPGQPVYNPGVNPNPPYPVTGQQPPFPEPHSHEDSGSTGPKNFDVSDDKSVDKSVDKSGDKSVDKSLDKSVDKSNDKSDDKL